MRCSVEHVLDALDRPRTGICAEGDRRWYFEQESDDEYLIWPLSADEVKALVGHAAEAPAQLELAPSVPTHDIGATGLARPAGPGRAVRGHFERAHSAWSVTWTPAE